MLVNNNVKLLFSELYGNNNLRIENQGTRYTNLLDRFVATFPFDTDFKIYSVPGRTEVGGNHTDHNAGRVLAAAIDLDILAVVSPSDDDIITIHSDGFANIIINTNETNPIPEEKFTSAALVRGVSSRLKQLGFKTGGFKALIDGKVPNGSGLSSSAAFEVLIATILNSLYNQNWIDGITIAKIAQYAENDFFGKPCGLMDQTACSLGGLVFIDFKDFNNPIIEKMDYNFSEQGYSIIIVDTGSNHADMNDDYTALEEEMKTVAKSLGGNVLREISKQKVIENISLLREKINDRAILRAFHFFDDDNRVTEQVNALKKNDLTKFFSLINESGLSSWMLCQNCYSSKCIEKQGISIALTLTKEILKDKGAWRVHGGGFAGTIQSFVPNHLAVEYKSKMKSLFGAGACHEIFIRSHGALEVKF
jgi:galactokinase